MSLLLLTAVILAGACRPDDQETQTINPLQARQERPPEFLAALDSGSTAYRAQAWEAALEQYTRAAQVAPGEPAGWFGIYMVQRALGHPEAADSALARAQELAPGATLIHPTETDSAGGGGGGGAP